MRAPSRYNATAVTELADGTLKTLAPAAAAVHIDVLWDKYLDELPDMLGSEGVEFELEPDDAQA